MFLYHYYDASMKPFQNLSDIPINEAKKILMDIATKKPNTQSAKRADEYLTKALLPASVCLSLPALWRCTLPLDKTTPNLFCLLFYFPLCDRI